jgi:hypothetical protein
MTDANELERLRARVAELEAELETKDPGPPGRETMRRSPWWAVSSAILLSLACLLAPLSVAAVWASTQISDTERYVQTVAPLADDPAVQQAIADDVTQAVLEAIDVETLTTELLTALGQQENMPPRLGALLPGLAAPISNGVESFTRDQVGRFVASPQFAALWEQVNRVAHQQIVTLLEGTGGGAVTAQGDQITLNLGPIITAVKERLVARGFTVASRIPAIDRAFVLVQSGSISDAQAYYRLLNTLGTWLPVVALALFAGGVFLARDRRRALLRGSLGFVAGMIVLGLGLAIGRTFYLAAVPPDLLSSEAAGSIFDTLVRFLRSGLRAVAVLGLVLALAAFVTGPSSAAVGTREFLERGIGSMRGGAEAAGLDTGRVGSWIYARKRALRVAVLIAAGVVLVFWTRPTAAVVLVTALLCLLVLGLIEFLGRPPVPGAPEPAVPPGAAAAGPEGSTPGGEAPRPPSGILRGG